MFDVDYRSPFMPRNKKYKITNQTFLQFCEKILLISFFNFTFCNFENLSFVYDNFDFFYLNSELITYLIIFVLFCFLQWNKIVKNYKYNIFKHFYTTQLLF